MPKSSLNDNDDVKVKNQRVQKNVSYENFGKIN